MKKLFIPLLLIITFLSFSIIKVSAESYLSDKTEVPINLEVSGAEALCQTDDGFVWIAQYSGLTRYDSKEFVTYKEFYENGEKYDIINVRALATKNNVLYIGTSTSVYIYENNTFSNANVNCGAITDIQLDKANDILYICSNDGLYVYNVKTKTNTLVEGTKDNEVTDVALDANRNTYYYSTGIGVYNANNECIFPNNKILDIYIYNDTLLIGILDGIVYRYDLKNNLLLDDSYEIGDQVNRILYSEKDKLVFVACENNGIYCIEEETGKFTVASDLENKSQLVDLMIDYEGNLWVASHYIGASGVSLITKNALLDLLFDDATWQNLVSPPSSDRNVYAIEKYDNIIYIAAKSGIYLYDVNTKKIIEDNIIMPAIKAYATSNNIPKYDFRDIEMFNGKLYFAAYNIGLVEYNPNNNDVIIYDVDYITNHINNSYNDPILTITNTVRCLRAFDNYLAIGYARGIMRFDGTNFDINLIGSNVLYINKASDGSLIFDKSKGLYTLSDDFSSLEGILVVKKSEEEEIYPEEVDAVKIYDDGNILKFLAEGDNIYYTLNSRLFCLDTKTNNIREIIIPYIKGSIVELSKVELDDETGNKSYKYVIGSQTQIYIANSLEDAQLTDYEFYDSTNGLPAVIANTSGYFDGEEQKYFFQSTNGIYVYDFNASVDIDVPTKITIRSVDVDGVQNYGNDLHLDKNVHRVEFNLSIFGFKPNKGHTIYYKLDGVDNDYIVVSEDNSTISYTNLAGGSYTFHIYVLDTNGQKSNQVDITITKAKQFYEQVWFWIVAAILIILLAALINYLIIHHRSKLAKRRENELKEITIESIEAIARTIDAKDNYTNGHSIRVGHFSRLIAAELGFVGDDLENLYYIALLHDIGKIGIPDAILNKPERLTNEEFAIMKSHTTKGANILKDISTIPSIVEGAKYHHEKYDGSGYPEGLKGEDIPYIARIICCADCYDAMATRRVYKEPYSKERMISEFEKNKGIQFDPNIADVVIKLIKEDKMGFNG